MGRSVLWALVFAGALISAGWAMERSGIAFPRLSQIANLGGGPSAEFLASPVIVPQLTGQAGYTLEQMVAQFERVGTTVSWEQDRDSWIMRLSNRDALTGNLAEVAIRFFSLPVDNWAGVKTPAVVAAQMVVNGEQLPDAQVGHFVTQFALHFL